MALNLPDFKDRKCLQLDFCGRIPEAETKEIGPISETKKALIAQYTKSAREVLIGVVLPFPGKEEEKHVHLRLSPIEKFEEKKPTINAEVEGVLQLVEPFSGKTVIAAVDGLFRVPLTDVSSFIRSTFVETSADKVQVQMTGGTLSVRGAPVHTITWKLGKDGRVEFVVQAKQKTKLDGDCLIEALNMVESAVKALVIGEAGG